MSENSTADDYLASLGLQESPFLPASFHSAPLISPIREQQLARAAHLCRYGEQMLVVVAGVGGGKSFFLSKLAFELVDIPQVHLLDALEFTSAEALFSELLQRLQPGFDEEPSENLGAALARLRSFLSQCLEPPLVLIDNAERLTDSELAMLLSLMASPGGAVAIKVVVSGDADLVARLDALNNLDVMIYDLELAEVTAQQWQDYCDAQLQSCGLAGTPLLSKDELRSLINGAHGDVGRVLQGIDAKLQAQSLAPKGAGFSLGLPPAHLAVLISLVACLVLVVLAGERLWGSGGQEEPEPQLEVVSLPEPLVPQTPTVVAAEPLTASAESSPARVEPAPVAPAANTVVPTVISAKSEPVALPAVPAPQPEQMSVPQAEKPAAEEPGTAIASPTQVSEAASPVAAPVKAGVNTLNLPGEHYVLQIMGASKSSALEDFVTGQPNQSSLHIVTMARSGGSWYVLLQGDYASAAAARAAIKTLPKSQQKDGVWPRKVADINRILTED
ncbi:SPOR domain-containing protein [Halioxenophilus sp. WMMB6]|uniref:SPOR domain-containing protein n=1 Tax=Halioxenophilus sp. WMMB6 TaxID=3073815 RepID=UPI00295E8D7B|nr:AAA family ATPase [Halioxenophilus sp. WMMB6]